MSQYWMRKRTRTKRSSSIYATDPNAKIIFRSVKKCPLTPSIEMTHPAFEGINKERRWTVRSPFRVVLPCQLTTSVDIAIFSFECITRSFQSQRDKATRPWWSHVMPVYFSRSSWECMGEYGRRQRASCHPRSVQRSNDGSYQSNEDGEKKKDESQSNPGEQEEENSVTRTEIILTVGFSWLWKIIYARIWSTDTLCHREKARNDVIIHRNKEQDELV